MRDNKILLRAVVVIAILWATVSLVRFAANQEVATAENFTKKITADFIELKEGLSGLERERRAEKIQSLAEILNRMSFQEREKLRLTRVDARFFDQLTEEEKTLWIDLTLKQSMDKMMIALDAMPAEERKQFVEKGLAELERGVESEDLERLQSVDSDLIEKITQEGLRAFYEKAGSETKMDLAPLMESMNEVMKGLRGQQFGTQS